jgi:hypothetical protein
VALLLLAGGDALSSTFLFFRESRRAAASVMYCLLPHTSHDGRESPHATHKHSGSIRGQEGLNFKEKRIGAKNTRFLTSGKSEALKLLATVEKNLTLKI